MNGRLIGAEPLAVDVLRQVGEHLFGTAERRLAVDHPRLAVQRIEGWQIGGRQVAAVLCRFECRQDFAGRVS
jgi:hypothetical protein